jgi:hypothetical protein
MRVRVCPKCQKRNKENAWDCVACGETLPMSSLVDTAFLQSIDLTSEGGQSLSNVSPYFLQDFQEYKDSIIQVDEVIVRGFNVTQIARMSPHKFGYIIITSERLIVVYFVAIPDEGSALPVSPILSVSLPKLNTNKRPNRPCLKIRLTARSMRHMLALDYPKEPLTEDEKVSRKIDSYYLNDLTSVRIESVGTGETMLPNLILKNKKGQEIILVFYMPHEAESAYKLISRDRSIGSI